MCYLLLNPSIWEFMRKMQILYLSSILWAILQFSPTQVSGQLFPTPIGSGCNSSAECVPNSDCVHNTCHCKPSFTLLSSLECKKDFDGVCSKESECNNAMGLHCINSVCKCTPEEEYEVDLGTCLNHTVKFMYQSVMSLINETEFELMRFNVLFNVFMIQARDPKALDSDVATLASEVNPVVYQRLEALEEEISATAEQSPIPAPETSTRYTTPEDILDLANNLASPLSPEPEVWTQLESPKTTRPVVTVRLPNPVQMLFNVATTARNNLRDAGRTPTQQTTSFPNFPTPTAPSTNTYPSKTPGGPTNPFEFPPGGSWNIVDDPAPGQGQGQGNALVTVLPNFVRMFNQFLPFLQGFNNVLTASILRPAQTLRNRQNQNVDGQKPPGQVTNVNEGNVRGATGGLFALPLRLLQVPGRIFNSLFGLNSPIAVFRPTLPRIDFSNRPILFLPWPFG